MESTVFAWRTPIIIRSEHKAGISQQAVVSSFHASTSSEVASKNFTNLKVAESCRDMVGKLLIEYQRHDLSGMFYASFLGTS